MIKKLSVTSIGILGAGASYDYLSESFIFSRTLRTIKCGLHILYAYKIAFNEENYLQIHESVAKDIYNTCIMNDGVYVKFGQGMATMDHLLPPPFYKHLSKLQDKAKAVTYRNVQKVFQQEVGATIEDSFMFFEKEPVASASLAQVHKAIMKDGREVAVKVQKPNIKKQFPADMMMHYLINYVLEKSFDLPLLHFVQDIQNNLRKELDFRIEADNSKKGKENFRLLKRNEIYVPEIIDEFTRERIMVSEWIDGFKITDEAKLKQLKFNKKNILHDLIRAFAEQIFVTGFIHCDPHPGNIFFRPHPNNSKKYQIVILDFGLCLEISEQFRKSYASFWKAMFLQDTGTLKRVCEGWGMPYSEHFAGLQLMRPFQEGKMLNKKVQKQDIMAMQSEMKTKMRKLMKHTINFPKELIFIGRNMNLVRSLNKFYGGTADRITIMAKSAYYGSQVDNMKKISNFTWSTVFSSIRFSFSLLILEIGNWITTKSTGKNIDQMIEDKSFEESQKMFQQYGFKPIDEKTYDS